MISKHLTKQPRDTHCECTCERFFTAFHFETNSSTLKADPFQKLQNYNKTSFSKNTITGDPVVHIVAPTAVLTKLRITKLKIGLKIRELYVQMRLGL